MVNRNLIRDLDADERDWELDFGAELGAMTDEIEWGGDDIRPNQVIDACVLRVDGEFVLVDVGYKCEGTIPLTEWDETEPAPEPGQIVKVLVEELEEAVGLEDHGLITLSKRKAERIEAWAKVVDAVREGSVVTGTVTRKIKGGLLVDIGGVSAFLPASQIDIRRTPEIGDFIGRTIQCIVVNVDEERRSIVVSRRALVETERAEKKVKLLAELEPGQIRKGVVKNIAVFGAFVDLGGMDGLLHISDMSWGRIGHPSEIVAIDQEIEVQVLHVDREKEKIALGLKQKTTSPWEKAPAKYPVGARVKGTVVSVMNYGAFVKLEEGIEGLVHVSEMSWTKRVSHPSEVVQVGEQVEVIVLAVNLEKQELALGIKQTQENPWDEAVKQFPEGTVVPGVVRNLTNYGAFVEIADGVDGLLHISDMSWTRKVSHPSEMVEKGQPLTCQVLSIDFQRRRIALGLKQLQADPWLHDIPERYQPGKRITGTVTKVTNFGVFVGLEDNLEGLVHVSELADHKVEEPEELVKPGDTIEVTVLRVDTEERKIGLTAKAYTNSDRVEPEVKPTRVVPPPMGSSHRELKGGVGAVAGPLIQPIESHVTAD
jgi:small subunit ribosomal protein S1